MRKYSLLSRLGPQNFLVVIRPLDARRDERAREANLRQQKVAAIDPPRARMIKRAVNVLDKLGHRSELSDVAAQPERFGERRSSPVLPIVACPSAQ